MMFIKTLVSLEKLLEAESVISNVINLQASTVTAQELSEAKSAIIHALIDNFASNRQIAASLLFIEKFKLPSDFFDQRPQVLANITLEEVQEAVHRHVTTEHMARIRIGRLEV
jgi:predicted Zn-dependent peptidase